MKTKIPLLCILVLFVANCTNQSDKKADNNEAQIVYVYTSIPYEKASFKLYSDQAFIGEIPFIDSTNLSNIPSAALTVYLKEGNQSIVAKDKEESFYSSILIDRIKNEMNIGFVNKSSKYTKINITNLSYETGFKQSAIGKIIVFRLD